MTNKETTLEEMLNSDLIIGLIEAEDEELKNAGWTMDEIRRFAKFLIKTNQEISWHIIWMDGERA